MYDQLGVLYVDELGRRSFKGDGERTRSLRTSTDDAAPVPSLVVILDSTLSHRTLARVSCCHRREGVGPVGLMSFCCWRMSVGRSIRGFGWTEDPEERA